MNKDLFKIGIGLVALSLTAILVILHPVIIDELNYMLFTPDKDAEVELVALNEIDNRSIIAADPYSSIVIPKIGANSKVIRDVDPTNSRIYQKALSQGVAHAAGTSLPGEKGNVFLFAHSSDNVVNANMYNSVFYLLNKLEQGDKIYLISDRRKFVYKVSETKLIRADEVTYLNKESDRSQVTLMTCWPAGTTLKRFIVIAELIDS